MSTAAADRPPIVFRSAYDQGFARVAAVTLPVHLADPAANAAAVITQARALSEQSVALAAFPELGLTGYSVDDLFLSDVLLDEALAALETIRAASTGLLPVLVVGAPLRVGNRLYNCAVVIAGGEVLGVVPKAYLPTYGEFYEQRYFAPGDSVETSTWISLAGVQDPPADRCPEPADGAGEAVVPFGPDLLFEVRSVPGLTFHVEVCEDMWVPAPPSTFAALVGATVLVNISSSPVTVGRAQDRELLARASSARNLAAYLYASAGEGESSTDLAWDGQTFVYENGRLLGSTERFPQGPRATVVDIDVEGLVAERLRRSTFDDNRETFARPEQHLHATATFAGTSSFRTVAVTPERLSVPRTDIGLLRDVDRFPFVPDDPDRLAQDCYEAYSIQVAGLVQRLRAIGCPKIVIGVSGGLDSTQALIVAARAVDRLGLPREHIHALTMPGFATSEETKANALRLATALGCHVETLDIRPTATQMLTEMRHPYGLGERGREVYDVTFENVQAGLRTDFLFRIANQRGGIVLGTGDLSELALGWCTFGVGDHMSHYGVNAGVPKTLIQHLIRWVASEGLFPEEVSRTLLAVLATEISPELVPAGEGEPIQSTQATIGPYALQDFTLWHVLRQGARPSRIAFLAEKAWADASTGTWPAGIPEEERVSYDLATIRRWETLFLTRFFSQQFKRSTLPNGPKVVAGGSLSPRGDWRMPSDASPAAWLAELERNVPES
ncbi:MULTISPECIES: NAD(+) synthase [unclassified Actinomyces]|uniref:NAD(+) synthase n=1 Tax=unclassified Actinomyces TaxID=2609248 RepID=UPI002016D1BD|nr:MULTISPECIES: NAD(+) synthase [unclassified Actinomyces]MCL3778143.1 NAD(+) synthase [Actinomyces sp. AC-20-1]MCL3789420.1 NAD(+) synthase [Actinomyces sp. 187325]MCL3791723.1 NAD(+) synthase [Actinomyces sp. 186855]MCL3794375.1 NAD(+) synthase [Actinomyces sp. 217892]